MKLWKNAKVWRAIMALVVVVSAGALCGAPKVRAEGNPFNPTDYRFEGGWSDPVHYILEEGNNGIWLYTFRHLVKSEGYYEPEYLEGIQIKLEGEGISDIQTNI